VIPLFKKHIGSVRILMVALSTVVLSAVGIGIGAIVGTAYSSATSAPVLYSSSASPQPPDWWSLSFSATAAAQVGDKVNLTSSSDDLGSATVIMDSQACETGSGTSCVSTPGATFAVPITLRIYNPGSSAGTVGSLIASETHEFDIPYRPSATPSTCPSGTASTFAGATLDGGEWLDSSTGTCYYGTTYAATFDSFTFTGSHVLPGTVVYGISFPSTASTPAQSLNVLFSTESADGAVTVGSDTDPGNLFVKASNASNDVGGSSGEITCATVGTASFEEYNTAVGSTGCGTDTQQGSGAPYEPIAFVPAVQINATS
jgi:hypothetical protein